MAMSEEVELLKEISYKLSQLIVLTKLTHLNEIKSVIEEIKNDEVAKEARKLADESLD